MFGKIKAKTAEEILEMIESLSKDEKEKLLSALTSPKTEDEEHIEDRGEEYDAAEQSDKEIEDESVGEQEHSGDEDSQPKKERSDESDEEEAAENAKQESAAEPSAEPEVKDDGEDRYLALTARIEALESMFNELRQAQEAAVEEEHNRDFGMNPAAPEGEAEDNHYQRVMRGYAKNNPHDYI